MTDAIARDYLLLALSVGELEEGIVDAYYGPTEIREQAARRRLGASELTAEAAALRARLGDEVEDHQRRRWMDRQVLGLETIARTLGGERVSYAEEVERCFDAPPARTPPSVYAQVRRELEELLPGAGSIQDRLEARDARLTIPSHRVGPVLDWVVGEVRRMCSRVFAVPEGESLTLTLVTDQPWSAYNWYDGDLRSRVEFNTDLPTRAHTLTYTLTHETFPGHHLEHAWKEQRLVREQGRAECSIQLINTPEAYISEGLAEVGGRLLIDASDWQALLLSIAEQASIPLSAEDAEREWRTVTALQELRGAGGDAAMLLYADGRSREDVVNFLVDEALSTPARAQKSLEFIEHPLWRTYVFCYAGGERLLTEWCRAAGDETAQRDRFFRLLTEQLTPSGIAEEMAAA